MLDRFYLYFTIFQAVLHEKTRLNSRFKRVGKDSFSHSPFFNINEFAEQVEYNWEIIMAIPEIGESNTKGNMVSSEGSSDKAYFVVKTKDVPTPSPGDTIRFQGDWQVVRIVESDNLTHRLECVANESPFGMR